MNTKIFTLLLMVMMTLTLSANGKTRSYFCQQINAPVSTGLLCPFMTKQLLK